MDMYYTDKELLDRVEAIGGKIEDDKYLIIGVQNAEDNFNMFDDKFFMFLGDKFKFVSTGTTNAGKTALKEFDKYGLEGAAVWKTNMFYEDLYSYGLHKGKMKALRQVAPIYYYRDNDRDDKAEQIGELHHGIIYANFHGISYEWDLDAPTDVVKEHINGWSFACQVSNQMDIYELMVESVRLHPKKCNYAILDQF